MRKINQIIFSDLSSNEKLIFTLTEFHDRYQIDETLFLEMLEEGLIEPQKQEVEDLYFDIQSLQRLQAALRLHRDLRVNIPGAVLALELMDELEDLRKELSILQRHFEK